MKYKYQLIILGTTENPIVKEILSQIETKITDLKLPKNILNIINRDNIDTEYVGNQPAFSIYFGDKEGKFNDLDITKKLIEDGTMVLPIFYTDFSKEIPKILENQNGIQFDNNELDRIANIVLQAFELLRNTRKVFISYKRSESTSVAIQMYEALESHNFDVFLDTHSIEKGEPFQDELWHRMTDCDVILLLNTPGFLESHWCKKELAVAGSKQIGIVQLIWPNHTIESISHLSYPLKLKKSDFENGIYNDKDNSKLNNTKVREIIQQVESVRARNLASRQDNLITEFRKIAKQCGRNITIQPERFLTEELSGKNIIYIPTIGIPQSTDCQSAEIRHEFEKDPNNTCIRLIYDDLRIRDKWLKHLDWLNDNFKKDILTLKKQDFEKWLQQKK
jgi:hypothetical protein